jgi:hypothetical protein
MACLTAFKKLQKSDIGSIEEILLELEKREVV